MRSPSLYVKLEPRLPARTLTPKRDGMGLRRERLGYEGLS